MSFKSMLEQAPLIPTEVKIKQDCSQSIVHAVMSNRPPVIGAAYSGELPMLEALHAKNPTSLHETDELGRNAVWYAALMGRLEAVKFLLKKSVSPHAKSEIKDCDHESTICMAVEQGYLGIAKELVKYGANPTGLEYRTDLPAMTNLRRSLTTKEYGDLMEFYYQYQEPGASVSVTTQSVFRPGDAPTSSSSSSVSFAPEGVPKKSF